jgi:hypothetical protein
MACEYLIDQPLGNDTINFHVDSQSALNALRAPFIKSDTVRSTKDLLSTLALTHQVSLQWVKAHIGIPGNEMADAAAKAGSKSKRHTRAIIKKTRTTQRNAIRQSRNLEWAELWLANEHCRQSKLFLHTPDPKIWQDIKHQPHQKTSRTVRFITGHCFMNRHNTLIDYGYTALDEMIAQCCLCEEEEETTEHLVTECPVLNQARLDNLYAWQLDKPPPWGLGLLNFLNTPLIIALELDRQSTGM